MAFHPPLFDLFPGMRVVLVAVRGIDNRRRRPEIERRLDEAWVAAREKVAAFENVQSHPSIAPWRSRLRAAGARPHDFPSSIEALMRRASKGGHPPRINPLVDFYNAVSLSLVVPVGGFDIGSLHDADIDVRLTHEGDSFDALDADRPLPVPAGEVAYATGSTVLTRHLVWRQSKPGLITAETTEAVLISEVLGEVEPYVLDAVSGAFGTGLERWFEPTSLAIGVADEVHPVFEA
jgi:DNA/RNA-binding domain of Phe-tRNA-synthetase-like protein